jgi:hypothetical protein
MRRGFGFECRSEFAGDPDELLRRYDAMLEEIPRARMRVHICLRAADGIVFVDTYPTRRSSK